MKNLSLFAWLSLFFILSCASTQKGLIPQQENLLKPVIKAGISQPELDTLQILINTGASENQIQARIIRFWNGRFQSLTPEEQSTYYSLSDSTDRIGYLSCRNSWERKLFLRRVVKKQKQALWKTEKDRIFYFSFKLVASDKELKEYLNLPDSLKQSWLYTFWKKKDPNPTTEENEFKREFDRRVGYSLYFFGVPFGQNRPWEDRGDVYILYGEPDEILGKEPSREKIKAMTESFGWEDSGIGRGESTVEVWHYYKYGSFQFDEGGLVPYVSFGQSQEEARVIFLKTVTEKVEVAKAVFVPDFGSPLDFPWNWWKFWSNGSKFGNSGDYYNVRINLGIPIEKLGLLSDSG
ncbi:MAG: GWxTD domain-containing protein, partial [candidate division Zixibacteria bacterium]|nr:GWxTD domain-containing protein [candidate division Zixibacteria bacterium]